MGKKILVTGASGYLGHQLCHKLYNEGYDVIGLDINTVQELAWPIYKIDLTCLTESFLKDLNIETVINAAALVPISREKKKFYPVNAQAALDLFYWARQRGCEHFIQISSSAVLGTDSSNLPFNELSVPGPFELYGKSKKKGEDLLMEAAKGDQSICLSIIRPRTILGKGRLGIFSIFFSWIKKNQKVILLGKGTQKYQFVHIDDLLALIGIIQDKKISGLFHCGGRDFSSLNQDIEQLIIDSHSKSKIMHIPTWTVSLGEIFAHLRLLPFSSWHFKAYSESFYFDLSMTMEKTGWSPRFGNREILLEAYQNYCLQVEGSEVKSVHRSHLKSKFMWLLTKLLNLKEH